MTITQPKLPIPPALQGHVVGGWTHHSIAVRLPDIARRVLDENDFSAAIRKRLETLIKEIPDGTIRGLSSTSAPDAMQWETYIAPYVGQTWLEIPWFFVETYFYRRVLEATGYFQLGEGYGIDPYAYQKQLALQTMQSDIQLLTTHLRDALEPNMDQDEMLIRFLTMSLWGNKADLSLWSADDKEEMDNLTDIHSREARVLVNDAPAVVDYLAGLGEQAIQIEFIMDNAGFELVCDLVLADFLLTRDIAQQVNLHLKQHPTFVSDTMLKDIEHTITFLAHLDHPDTQALASRLSKHLKQERLLLRTHPYWTSSLPFWQQPPIVRQTLSRAHLLISKGDANYRRLLGDSHWPFTTPFADILAYTPAPLVTLRTQKSEIVVGLQPHQAEQAAEQDPNWLINGEWGVIQFVIGD